MRDTGMKRTVLPTGRGERAAGAGSLEQSLLRKERTRRGAAWRQRRHPGRAVPRAGRSAALCPPAGLLLAATTVTPSSPPLGSKPFLQPLLGLGSPLSLVFLPVAFPGAGSGR